MHPYAQTTEWNIHLIKYRNLENIRHLIIFVGGQIHKNLSHEIILTRIISYKC